MGVRGAALATLISQALSAVWVCRFLTGEKTLLKLSKASLKLEPVLLKRITGLGMSGFVMSVTNGSVQIMCNATLQKYGGDLYVGVMTVSYTHLDVYKRQEHNLHNIHIIAGPETIQGSSDFNLAFSVFHTKSPAAHRKYIAYK